MPKLQLNPFTHRGIPCKGVELLPILQVSLTVQTRHNLIRHQGGSGPGTGQQRRAGGRRQRGQQGVECGVGGGEQGEAVEGAGAQLGLQRKAGGWDMWGMCAGVGRAGGES